RDLAVVARLGAMTIAYDLVALAGEATARGQFVLHVQRSATLTDAQRRRILVTGLRALEGRDDLEVQ
ncbi:MAG TPA: hypothetical protein VE196_07560, partial [Pseudonocardiaceae bacterium]|nr:hypothetical protein [Pseudonocardiaceae bacterium]